jgi:hypothetical protein
MKINRFIALAGIALLVVGSMSAFVSRSSTLGAHSPAAQANACAQDQADGTEVASAATVDTDNVELQCGDQAGADSQETVGAADTDNVNLQEQVGDQSGPDTGLEAPGAPETAAPVGK